jgi:hypothetical protein
VSAGPLELEEDFYEPFYGDLFTKFHVTYLMILAENASQIAGREENVSGASSPR